MGLSRQITLILCSIMTLSNYNCVGYNLTLADSIKYSIAHSPIVDSERKQRDIRQFELTTSTSKFFPSLDLTSEHGIDKSSLKTATDPWASQIGLKLSENIYDNGESVTRYKISKLKLSLSEVSLKKAEDKLTLDVATETYRLSRETKLAEVRTQQLATLRTQFESVKNQYHQGMKRRQDYLRLKADVQRAEIDDLNAKNSLESSRISLRRILGSSVNQAALEFKPLEISIIHPPSKDLIPDNTHDYKMGRLQRAVNELGVDLEERKYWPQVNLTTSIHYQNGNYLGGTSLNTNQKYGWNVLLSLNYNLWDWGIRKRDAQIAEAKKNIDDNTVKLSLLAVDADIRTLALEIAQFSENYRSSKALLDSEEEAYRSIKTDYQEGRVTYLDLIKSLNDLLDARVRFFTTHFGLLEKVAKYRFFEGTIYETLTQ